jgi:hypothetical protein
MAFCRTYKQIKENTLLCYTSEWKIFFHFFKLELVYGKFNSKFEKEVQLLFSYEVFHYKQYELMIFLGHRTVPAN